MLLTRLRIVVYRIYEHTITDRRVTPSDFDSGSELHFRRMPLDHNVSLFGSRLRPCHHSDATDCLADNLPTSGYYPQST